MESTNYLKNFQDGLDRLDKRPFNDKQLELKVGIWHNSVVLKIQKKSWLNQSPTGMPFRESIFFSVWLNDELSKKRKLYYNIHALKLRQLEDYSIKSREFAEAFRAKFKVFENEWPNVSIAFGPLTLMEGWVEIDIYHFEHHIVELACKFLKIEFIIDDLLKERKK